MTDETNSNEEFLGDLKDNADKDPLTQENEDAFASIDKEVKENPVEVTEEKEEVEKPIPFHKDPKVQRYIEKEISKRIPEPTQEKESQEDYFDGVVKAFTSIVGNDTPEKVTALNALKDSLSTLEQRTVQKAFDRQDSVRQEELRAEKEAEDELTEGFEAVEQEIGVDLYAPENNKLRGRFIDFIKKVAPKEDGEISSLPDIVETFKAFQSLNKTQTQTPRAKELASQSIRSEGAVQQNETGRTTWDNVMEKIGL